MLNEIANRRKLMILEVMLLLAICYVHALGAGHYSNFFPINGTFQNYNPVRRLLSGQIPYKDFGDYLGMGHLYLGTIVTALLGGTYNNSLVAFSLLSILGLALIIFCISRCITEDSLFSISLCNLILFFILVRPETFDSALAGDLRSALIAAKGPGNSARYVRGIILPLYFFIYWGLNYLLERKLASIDSSEKQKRKFIFFLERYKEYLLLGICAGGAFTWSNDYGISLWICSFLFAGMISVSVNRRLIDAIKDIYVCICASIIIILITATIFSYGHPLSYFSFVFGTGGYQSWYYNEGKSHFIFDVDLTFHSSLQLLVFLTYFIFLYKSRADKHSIMRYGMPCLANMVSFCAVQEYHILSGGYSREVAFAVLFITIVAEALRFLLAKSKRWVIAMLIISTLVSVSWVVDTIQRELFFTLDEEKDGIYIAEMDGNVSGYADDLISAHSFLNGEFFFSTYAGAQEVVEGVFQPSGTDYIIHVLGDSQRAKYLDSFESEEFTYVATIKDSGNIQYEGWIQRANWFFYRELLDDWHPVFSNSYETYWARNEAEDGRSINATPVIEENADGSITIKISCNDAVDGILELKVKYKVVRNDRFLAKIMFNPLLRVHNIANCYKEDYYESNYLPAVGDEYIPVTVENGYGEILLAGDPVNCTNVMVDNVEIGDIYPAYYNYVEVVSVFDSEEGTGLVVSPYGKYKKNVLDSKTITINDIDYVISNIDGDDSYFYIYLPEYVDIDLEQGNMFLIRK